MTHPTPPESPTTETAAATVRGLEQRLLRRFRRLGKRANVRIVVAFSGGVDSLCLAATLKRIARAAEIYIRLVHIDHGMRAESSLDADRARELAERLDLPIDVIALAPGIVQRAAGTGLEEAARRERYLVLADAARAAETRLIALAHHQKDQAESVLLHVIRGAGLAGATGMREIAEVEIPWWTAEPGPRVQLWRPLLAEPRELIESVVASLDLEPVVDPSNDDPRFLRNWLRASLLPGLEARSPGAAAGLARFAEIAGEDDRLLAAIANARLAEALSGDGALHFSALRDEPRSIKRRAVRMWLERAAPDSDPTLERVDEVLRFAERARPDAKLEIGAGAIVVWRDGGLIAGPLSRVTERLCMSFEGPLAGDGFRSARLQSGVPVAIDGWTVTAFGPDDIQLRAVRPGDRFAGTSLRLREHARAHRVHPLLRDRLLAAVGDAGPIWTAGLPLPANVAAGSWRFELTKLEEAG